MITEKKIIISGNYLSSFKWTFFYVDEYKDKQLLFPSLDKK